MEISGEKDFPAKKEKDFPAKILEISEEVPSNPLKEIVKTDAGKENIVVDKVVNGKNGVLKIANGGRSKETESETAVKTLSTDISNGEKVSQLNGDEKCETSTSDNNLEDTIDNILEDTVLEDEPDQKESVDSADILPTKEETSENVNCEQSTDGQSKEEDAEEEEEGGGEIAIGDKEESSPEENGVHDQISDDIEEKEGIEVDVNGEQSDELAEEEEDLEEKEKEHLVNNKTKKDAVTPEISDQSDQADRESIESSLHKKEDNGAMEESEEEVTEDTSEDTLEKEEDSQDGCEAREPNKPEEKEENLSDSETDKLKAAVADDASEEEELDMGKSLEASLELQLENLERKLEEESDEVTPQEVPTREGSVNVKEGESGEKEKDVPLVTGNSSDADDEGDSKMSTDQNDSEAEEPNAEEALASLAQIEKNTKRILDDDWNDESDSSRKRTADDGNAEPSVKKAKLDSEPKAEGSDEAAAMKKKIKKSLKKLKRSEIEEMIATKCVELLTNKSEVGKLRQQVWVKI